MPKQQPDSPSTAFLTTSTRDKTPLPSLKWAPTIPEKASTTSYGKRADINNDGKVDGTDINILINIILDKNN